MTGSYFLSAKFEGTTAGGLRPNLEYLPKTVDSIKRKEFDLAVNKKMNLGKATGPDGVPAVV